MDNQRISRSERRARAFGVRERRERKKGKKQKGKKRKKKKPKKEAKGKKGTKKKETEEKKNSERKRTKKKRKRHKPQTPNDGEIRADPSMSCGFPERWKLRDRPSQLHTAQTGFSNCKQTAA